MCVCVFVSLILPMSKLKNIIIFYLLSLLGFLTIPSTIFLDNYLVVFMLFFSFLVNLAKLNGWLLLLLF